jgi:hypothetical protein
MTAIQSVAHAEPVATGLRSTAARELNAVFAIAWREVLRAIKSPVSLAITIVFPIIFMGILGGSISQNLGGALPYAYLPFMLIGMIANTLYQGTITGVTNLVEERENDFTAELFVAPISRYAVLIGKIIGSAVAALISLVGIIAMIFVMQIPLDFGDLLRVPARRGSGRRAARLPADVPRRRTDPDRRLERHPRRPREAHADDVLDRPGAEHLLRGQARVRRGGPPSTVARRDRDGRAVRGLHGGRDLLLRPRGPQPLGPFTIWGSPGVERVRVALCSSPA